MCASSLSFLLLLVPTVAVAAEGPSSAGSLLQVLFGLAVVLGLLAAAAWGLKRFGVTRLQSWAPVKVVGGVSVGARERVMVLEVADQWVVVGVAPGRVNTLLTLPRQENVPSQEPAPAPGDSPFANWLRQTIDKRNGK